MRNAFRPLFREFPVNRLRQEMDRVVNQVFAPMVDGLQTWSGFEASGPRLNVWEENDVFYAEAEVPGLRQEDLDVSVVGNQLSIKGRREATSEKTDKETVFHRRERSVGEFTRVVTLPAEVNPEAVSATLNGGVLTVKLPKAETAKPRKINVQG
jgi:HSP20 family protein